MFRKCFILFLLTACLLGFAVTPEPTRATVAFEADAPYAELNRIRSKLNLTNLLIEERQKKLVAIVQAYQETSERLAILRRAIELNRIQLEEAKAKLKHAQELLAQRVEGIYRQDDSTFLMVVLGSEDFSDFLSRMDFLLAIADMDRRLVEEVKELQASLETVRASIESKEREEASLLSKLQAEKQSIDAELVRMRELYESLSAKAVLLEERTFTFPVAAPFAYSNDWHNPRDGGARLHEGTDIFALHGTPVVAALPGVISSMSTEGLGGIVLYLRSRAGDRYYYAHLSAYAPGISIGSEVKSGQVLGYVGNTGNARGTPPHLHFGIYMSSGPVNPHPILKRAEDNGAVVSQESLAEPAKPEPTTAP